LGTLDIAGDKQGWKRALWAPVLVIVLCFLLYFTFNHNFELLQKYCLPIKVFMNGHAVENSKKETTDTIPSNSNKNDYVHNRNESTQNDESSSSQPKKRVISMSIDEEISF
jgi:ABC-type methionine transport system ATPase subunit